MFGRQKPRSSFAILKSWLWPSSGLQRGAKYILRRLQRMRGSPHALASGFAFGAAVSFLPVPGLHFIIAAILSAGLRVSIIASAIGTIVGNPWTFPFIWISSFRLGRMLGFGEQGDVTEKSLSQLLQGVASDVWRGDFQQAARDSLPVFQPMLIGGLIMGVVAWIVFYFGLRRLIQAYQSSRQNRIQAKKIAREKSLHSVEKG